MPSARVVVPMVLAGGAAGLSYCFWLQDQQLLQESSSRKRSPEGEGCPVDHSAYSSTRVAPSAPGGEEKSGCPMSEQRQALDPSNAMLPPNQRPAPGQKMPLPTERLTSSIPRAQEDKEENWQYPSQQMFYNAMLRKGWEGVSEEDVQAIVSIHNTTNERCWAEVLRWELSFHSPGDEEVGPKLKKFRGNFRKLSPKARMKMLFTGSKRPFDRHDWVVDRNGVEVRYIIDFYEGRNVTGMVSQHLDVRPALDSFGAFVDRVRMYWGIAPRLEDVIAQAKEADRKRASVLVDACPHAAREDPPQ